MDPKKPFIQPIDIYGKLLSKFIGFAEHFKAQIW